MVQKYDGFCRWVAAENVAEATVQLAEVAKIARVATDNKPTRQWVSEMYQALDEGIFRDQVSKKKRKEGNEMNTIFNLAHFNLLLRSKELVAEL